MPDTPQQPKLSQKDYLRLVEETKEIVAKAATFIREERKSFDPEKIIYKGTNDMVSYVDQTAEKIIVEGLQEILPEAGFIAEEGSGEPKEGLNWIIDPLDGTTNFIHDLPVYGVSVALADGKELVLGVVHEVASDEVFWASKNNGAYSQKSNVPNAEPQKLKVSKNKTPDTSLVATGFPYYEFGSMEKYLGLIAELMQTTHGLRRLGAASIDLIYTACGKFEAFFEFNLKPWDVAGGAIIVKEAGGIVTDWAGTDDYLFGDHLLCANPDFHPYMLKTIKKHWF